MATTENLPPGIYRIIVAELGKIGPDRLTRHGEKGVTVLPPDAAPEPEQEWRVSHGKDGNIIIERPSKFFPGSYLTYDGAPKKPEEGDRVVYHIAEFPLNEWHVGIAPGFRLSLHVAGSDLGIQIAPPTIYPPFLELKRKDQLYWVFERIRDE